MRSLVSPRLLPRLRAAGRFADSATVEANLPTRSGSGGLVASWTFVPSHVGIPAQVAPSVAARARGETRSAALVVGEATHRIALAGFYPAITSAMRLAVVGAHPGIYDIVRVDQDSAPVMTVLEVRMVTPVAEAGA